MASELVDDWRTKARAVRKALSFSSREEAQNLAARLFSRAPEPERVFASEDARIAWETALAVERLASSMPAEGSRLDLTPVLFDAEHERRGLRAVFTAGTVVGTSEDFLLVPERTIRILDELKIPYHVVAHV